MDAHPGRALAALVAIPIELNGQLVKAGRTGGLAGSGKHTYGFKFPDHIAGSPDEPFGPPVDSGEGYL